MKNKAKNIILAVVLAIVVFLITNIVGTFINAYNPNPQEPVYLTGETDKKLSPDKIKILSFNTCHAALGKDSDSSKEGGNGRLVSAENVLINTRGICEIVNLSNADAVILQDVDRDSYRSRYVDEYSYYLGNSSLIGAYALDYKSDATAFLPPYKKVEAGLLTLSEKGVFSAERVSLPSGYDFLDAAISPKRAMLVTRYNIEGTENKLVLINFELDAYTTEEKRTQQLEFVIDYAQKAAQNGDYVVAGGSFYMSFDQTAERYPLKNNRWKPGVYESANLKKGWKLCYDAAVATARVLDAPYDSKMPQEDKQLYVADGFIVSPNIEVKMAVTVDQQFRYSAHNPVLLEIKLK